MNIIDFVLYIVTACAVVLAVLVWTRRRHHLINISFSLFAVTIGLWSFTMALFRMADTTALAAMSLRMMYVMATLLVCTFIYFAHEFPFVRKPFYEIFRYAIPIPFVLTILIVFFSDWFIAEVVITPQGTAVVLGSAYVVWLAWATMYLIWAAVELYRKYRIASSLHRLQLRYMLVAVALPTIISIPTFGVLPALGDSTYMWLGPVATLALIGVVSYAISRHRLMDIRLLLRHALTFTLAVAILLTVVWLVLYVLNTYFDVFAVEHAELVTAFVVFSLALAAFNPVLTLTHNAINRFVFREYYSHEESLRSLSKDIATVIAYDELIALIMRRIMETVGLHKAALLVKSQPVSTIGFTDAVTHSVAHNDFLTTWFTGQRQALLFEEMEYRVRVSTHAEEQRQLQNVQRLMVRHGIGVFLPMYYQEELYGVVVLGRKLSDDVFTTDDLELLEAVLHQATIALEHARMYRDIQHIVDEQTAEITKKNENLKELLRIKSDFLTIASHQLRTPMTAIRGFLSFLVEEDMPAEDKVKFAQQAYESANRMELVVNDILTASELEGHDVEVTRESTNLVTICEQAIAAAKPLIVNKNVNIIFVQKTKHTTLLTDGRRIKECIDNLLANAVSYTAEGTIAVKLDRYRQYMRISVKDSGIGFTKQEAKEFGEKFYRAERIRKQVANGSGLGLFITNTFMNALGGKLVFKSKGKNKGSEFALLIPK